MRMSHLASIVFACSISIFATASFAQASADDGRCDVLSDFTPSLYGLCIAYWATQENGNSEASSKILEKYNARKSDGVDPDMPGLAPCPCWTAADLVSWDTVNNNKCDLGPSSNAPDGYLVWNNSSSDIDVYVIQYYEDEYVTNPGVCQAVIAGDTKAYETNLDKNSSDTCFRELVRFCDDSDYFVN